MAEAGLRLADLKRAASAETVAELTARVVTLEAAIAAMTARLKRLEAARKDRGEAEYQIGALIG